MRNVPYKIEAKKPFSKSLIWQLNRDYYNSAGIEAWKDGPVPHHLTSNSMVGKTYAELIFAALKDLANKGQTSEKVYILELGAGHGRLAFHILKHLERIIDQNNLKLPPYCYVLSDIVADNLTFFQEQHQFQTYFEKGLLDFAFFDAIKSTEIQLQHSGIKITTNSLVQPLIAIGNYFFDSIPNNLFYLENTKISECWVEIEGVQNPKEIETTEVVGNLKLTYSYKSFQTPFYEDAILNDMLNAYRLQLFGTYLFFPKLGINCINRLEKLSQKGLILLTMDKGFHELHDLENAKEPDFVTHGSFSFPVNYHAFKTYCEKKGGVAFFPSMSNFDLEIGCLLFAADGADYSEIRTTYERYVNDFGPDDYYGLSQFNHKHIEKMTMRELIGMLRLGGYDSTIFKKVLPRIKQVSQRITFNERTRLAQTLHQTWNMYFSLNEKQDLAFEIGGIFYALGLYQDALDYFQFSINNYGHTADGFYNRALCYYQLRDDALFLNTVKEAEKSFPNFKQFDHLRQLDLGAA